MGARTDHIESFARFIGEGTPAGRTYYLLDPTGEHQYLFAPAGDAIRLTASLVSGEGFKRTAGNYLLRGAAHSPALAKFLPLVSTVEVALPNPELFDVAVVSNRTRLIAFDSRRVYTIGTDNAAGVRTEIEVRRSLPGGINTPELYGMDSEYPYFCEAFVDGSRPRSPVDDWSTMRTALEQLTTIYGDQQAKTRCEALREDIEQRLETNGRRARSPYREALHLLDELELPEAIYTAHIHGDFHTRNVLARDDDVYLLDWEHYRQDLVCLDFFNAFAVSYYDTRDPIRFIEMIRGEDTGGRIYRDYMKTCDEFVCSSPKPYSGLPVLYLLDVLSREDRGAIRESYRELLEEVVARVSTTRS